MRRFYYRRRPPQDGFLVATARDNRGFFLGALLLGEEKMRKIKMDRIERAARIYASNEDASRALGIAPGSFSRLCRRYGIETPYARKRRHWREARRRSRKDDLFDLNLDGQIQEAFALEESLE